MVYQVNLAIFSRKKVKNPELFFQKLYQMKMSPNYSEKMQISLVEFACPGLISQRAFKGERF
jgi:hypothetical protein